MNYFAIFRRIKGRNGGKKYCAHQAVETFSIRRATLLMFRCVGTPGIHRPIRTASEHDSEGINEVNPQWLKRVERAAMTVRSFRKCFTDGSLWSARASQSGQKTVAVVPLIAFEIVAGRGRDLSGTKAKTNTEDPPLSASKKRRRSRGMVPIKIAMVTPGRRK